MKKEILRKWILPVGTIALATLPFVSVISCSNNNGGKQENPGGGDGGGATPEPTPTKEILNHSNTFVYPRQNGIVDTPNLLLDFDSWKQKILNNQIKWFNDDGSSIIYEVNIKIEPGLINASDQYVDVNAPQKVESVNGGIPENYWKQINSAINVKWEFWLNKYRSMFDSDHTKCRYMFNSSLISKSPYCLGIDKKMGTSYVPVDSNNLLTWKDIMRFAFPIDQNIAVARSDSYLYSPDITWLGIDLTASEGIYLSSFRDKEAVFNEISMTTQHWIDVKDKFKRVDGPKNNLVWLARNSDDYQNSRYASVGNYFSNVKGTLTIKPKQS